MKFSTRGLKTYIQTLKTVPVADTIVAASNTKPVVMLTANPTIYADGDLIKVMNTGWSCLDNRYFKVRNINGNPTGAPIAAAVGGPTTASVTVTFSGGPAASPGNVQFTINAGAGTGTFVPIVNIASKMTAGQIAAAVAAYLDVRVINGIPIKATYSGAVVTVTIEAGGNFVGFSATIAGTAVQPSTGQFELECSDGSAQAAALGAVGTTSRLRTSQSFVPFCLSSISRERPAAEPVSTATFCDPQGQVSGDAPSEGTLTWGGPIDLADLGFCEMRRALSDGKERLLMMEYPSGIGSVIMPLEVNQYSEDFALQAAATWTGSALIKAAPSYIIAAVDASGNVQCSCSCP